MASFQKEVLQVITHKDLTVQQVAQMFIKYCNVTVTKSAPRHFWVNLDFSEIEYNKQKEQESAGLEPLTERQLQVFASARNVQRDEIGNTEIENINNYGSAVRYIAGGYDRGAKTKDGFADLSKMKPTPVRQPSVCTQQFNE